MDLEHELEVDIIIILSYVALKIWLSMLGAWLVTLCRARKPARLTQNDRLTLPGA